jgi:hypothetical protein
VTEVVAMEERERRSAEHGVDAWVDGSWLDLRLRLAEWMLTAPDHNTLVIDPAPDGLDAPTLQLSTTDDARFLALAVGDPDEVSLPVPYALTLRDAGRLTDLGFVPAQPTGNPVLALDRDDVDRLAHAATIVLQELWGVVSPAFLSLEAFAPDGEDDVLAWASADDDVPTATLPTPVVGIVRASSVEDLQANVEAMVQEMVVGPLLISTDGAMRVQGPGGHVDIRVRDLNLVEVITILAREVGFKRAHRHMDRLSHLHREVRFFLERDTLVATVAVPASPLAADHLRDAVGLLLRIHEIRPELDLSLKRRRAKVLVPLHGSAPTPDSALLAIAGDALTLGTKGLVVMLGATAADRETLDRWTEAARWEWKKALHAVQAAKEPAREAHRNQSRRWMLVVSALHSLLGSDGLPPSPAEDV